MSDDETSEAPQRRKLPAESKGILGLAAVAVIGMSLQPLLFPRGAAVQQHPAVGRSLMYLDLEPLTFAGSSLELDDLKGKVVLLNFWGPWCPPCCAELPHLARIGSEFGGREDFCLLPVACEAPGSDVEDLLPETAAMLQRKRLDVPVYSDPRGQTRLGVHMVATFNGYPTTLVIDRGGVIRGLWEGYQAGSEREMAALVAQLLAEEQ